MSGENELLSPKKSLSENIWAAIKVGVAAVPSVGGFLSTFLDECLSRSTHRAVVKAMQFVHERVEGLEDRVDAKTVDEDELSDAWKSFMRSSVSTSQDEKLRAAANLLANTLLHPGDPEKLSYTERDHFVRCLDALSIGAIQVLGFAYRMTRARGARKNQIGEYEFQARDLVGNAEGMPPRMVMSLVGELSAWRLLRSSDPGVTLPGDGYAENEPVKLTPTGERFVEYVLKAGESARD